MFRFDFRKFREENQELFNQQLFKVKAAYQHQIRRSSSFFSGGDRKGASPFDIRIMCFFNVEVFSFKMVYNMWSGQFLSKVFLVTVVCSFIFHISNPFHSRFFPPHHPLSRRCSKWQQCYQNKGWGYGYKIMNFHLNKNVFSHIA